VDLWRRKKKGARIHKLTAKTGCTERGEVVVCYGEKETLGSSGAWGGGLRVKLRKLGRKMPKGKKKKKPLQGPR